MNKKYIIIILTITFLALLGGLTYTMFFNEYTETVNFDGTTLTIPHTFFDKMLKYKDNSGAQVIENPDKYTIKYFYWGDDNLIDAINFGKEKLSLVGQTNNTGPNPVKTTYNGETVYVCFTSEIEHGNILIISKNPETAKKIYESIKSKPKNTTNNKPTIPTNLDVNTQSNNNANQITNTGQNNKEQTTYVGKDGKTHSMEEAYSVDYSSGDLNTINEQRRERGMSEISA